MVSSTTSASPSVSLSPSASPSAIPSVSPSDYPSVSPTAIPSLSPSDDPSDSPSAIPSLMPTISPCSLAVASNTLLWPPNHKFWATSVQGVTDPDGNELAITIVSVESDEQLEIKKGVTVPDAVIVGQNLVNLRAKRLGGGDGRVYVISFTAITDGGTCEGTVKVGVPHDQDGSPPLEGSPLYPATVET